MATHWLKAITTARAKHSHSHLQMVTRSYWGIVTGRENWTVKSKRKERRKLTHSPKGKGRLRG